MADLTCRLCHLLRLFPCADHYAAKLAGLVPTDPLAAALADQAYFFVEDVLQVRHACFCVIWQCHLCTPVTF
jgi:hypothetical protein